jgi:hypothetical protein
MLKKRIAPSFLTVGLYRFLFAPVGPGELFKGKYKSQNGEKGFLREKN